MRGFLIRQTLVRDSVIVAESEAEALLIASAARTWSNGDTVTEEYDLIAQAEDDRVYPCGWRRGHEAFTTTPDFSVRVRHDGEYGWVVEEVHGANDVRRVKHDIATRDQAKVEGYAHKAELIV